MKGMNKISRGTGFRGVLDYCFGDPNARMLPAGNMGGTNPRELAREFSISRKMRDVKKPVWHTSLRLPAGEHLPDETWNAIVQEYMREMGFSEDHQFCVVQHDDPYGQHIHIVASRVAITGHLFYGRHENLLSTK